MKIKNNIKPQSNDDYWKVHMQGEELTLLKRPCKDCAMTCGFYESIADELLKENIETQDKVLKRWFCHNNSKMACRGAHNYILENR